MVSLNIKNPFLEYKIYTECEGSIENFLNKIQNFFENEEKELVMAYEREELTIGQIAEKLKITKEDVFKLLDKYNIDLVDYDLKEDMELFKEVK